jgi:hypothetical protein
MLFDDLDPKKESETEKCWEDWSEIPSGRNSRCRGYERVEILVDQHDGKNWYGGERQDDYDPRNYPIELDPTKHQELSKVLS